MVLAVRLAAPPLASAGEDGPAAGWLSVAIVPAAALPSATPALQWERQPREGFGASGA